MKKILKITIYSLVISFSLFFINNVYTAGLQDAQKNIKPVASAVGAENVDVQDVVGVFLNAALTFVGLVFMVLMVYAGYLWMTAAGEEEQVKKSQKIIVGSIIGMVILLSSYAITVFISDLLNNSGL